MAAAAAGQDERVLPDPEAFFGLTPAAVEEYAQRAEESFVDFYLRTGTRRSSYLVVAVDPAGGGSRSEEAFVVFLVTGDRFALLTARTVQGHDRAYDFSTVPLVFVLALIETVRAVRGMLLAAAARSRTEFRLPPVLVVMESNFAYGAAVYMQLMWFVRHKLERDRDLAGVEIIFATPVYLRDGAVETNRQEAQDRRDIAAAFRERLGKALDAVRQAWVRKGPKRRGLNLVDTVDRVWKSIELGSEEVVDPIDTGLENIKVLVERTLANLRRAVEEAHPDATWLKAPTAWTFLSELESVLTEYMILRRRCLCAQRDARVAQATAARDDRGGATGLRNGPDDLFRARAWPEGHDVPAPDAGASVTFPPRFWWNAPKTTLGENTSLVEKIQAFRYWVGLPRVPRTRCPGHPPARCRARARPGFAR